MVAGGLLLVAAAARLPGELRDGEPSAPTGPLCVGQPCRANGDPRPVRGYEAPSIVVDQADPAHQVVVDANVVENACTWHTTFDGGLSWQDGEFEIPPPFTRCELNSNGFLAVGNAAMGSGQTIYVVLSSARQVAEGEPAVGESVLLATSADGGRTFSPAREILPGPPRPRAYVRPAVSAALRPDGADRLLVSVWGCGDGRCEQGFFLRSDDGGASFGPPVLVTPDPGGNSPSQPVMAADGSIYMTFLRRYEDRTAELLVARSGDDGRSFDSGVIDKQNNLGGRYESAVIRVDPTRGWIYLVYSDTRAGPSRVYFRRSKDQARSWEPVVRLHTSGGGRSYGPALEVAPDGRIDVVFYRRGPDRADDVHATWSTDGGSTFAEDEKLTDRSIDRTIGYADEIGGFYNPAVASSAATAFYAWSDTRNGTPVTNSQETFTRRVDRRAPPAE